MILWLAFVVMGVLTFAIRLSFIQLLGRITLSLAVQRALRYVPVAALSALVVPALVAPGGRLDLTAGNERLLAGLVAGLVAYRTHSALATIGIGMACLWLLQGLAA